MIIPPGATIGVVGGGQLGRMFALAARQMGYRLHVLEPMADSPAGQVADQQVQANYDDVDAACRFAAAVEVVTFEFENVPAETLQAIAHLRPIHPAPNVLHICRHRLREKDFLRQGGFPVAPYQAITQLADLRQAIKAIGFPAVLKTVELGYDGKGQQRLDADANLDQAWRQLGANAGVLEAWVPFDQELSVICARGQDGQMVCFPPTTNVHARHILDVTTAPASVSPTLLCQAMTLAQAVAEALQVVGLLAVEMFVVGERLLINELAPRPHNSGHYTIDACVTSQFEQHLRAICGLPLGDVQLFRPAAMVNLLGDLWANGEPRWEHALAFPEVKLHLYGKQEARPGRKMGHLTALGETTAKARERALAAREALGGKK